MKQNKINLNLKLDVFDHNYYINKYPEEFSTGQDSRRIARFHYIQKGINEGKLPHPDFNNLSEFPLINILVKFDNQQNLPKCLESILHQDYSNLKIIIGYIQPDQQLLTYQDHPNIQLFRLESINESLEYIDYQYYNQLLAKVSNGWLIYLDTTDHLKYQHGLLYLSYNLLDQDRIILWTVKKNNQLIYPKDLRQLGSEDLVSCSFCIHSNLKDQIKWKLEDNSEFELIKKIYANNSNFKLIWINYGLVYRYTETPSFRKSILSINSCNSNMKNFLVNMKDQDFLIYIINLNERPDRMLFMDFKMNELNLKYETITAINGLDFKYQYDSYMNLFTKSEIYLKKNINSLGAYGLLLTYKNKISNLYQTIDSHVMIFEDDICFHKDFKNLLNKYVEVIKDNDVIWLGCQQVRWKSYMITSYRQNGYYDSDTHPYYVPWGTYGMVYSKSFLKTLNMELEKDFNTKEIRNIDIYLSIIIKNLILKVKFYIPI